MPIDTEMHANNVAPRSPTPPGPADVIPLLSPSLHAPTPGFFDMGLLTDSRAGAGDGSARTGDVTRGRDHSTLGFFSSLN